MNRAIRLRLCLALCATMLTTVPVLAADKALNLSVFTPVSLAKAEDAVTAFRFNLFYGRNTSVKMVDIGLVNHTTTLSNGLQWGAVNFNEGDAGGIQLATINYNKGKTQGLQLAGLNYAENGGGLQLAFLNYATRMDGVQIGAINIIREGGFLPVCIIANWGKK